MPDITLPAPPSDDLPGVKFVDPPESLVPGIMASMDRAVQALPADANGALVAVATTTGWNAAVITRVPGKLGFDVETWIGSKWGEPISAGARIRKVW